MPASKRRKPKRHLPPNAMPKWQAKAHFKQLAQMDGQTFDLTGRTLTVAPGTEDTPAFTNAWAYARAFDLDYAEGVVWRDDTGWTAHAWCVENGTIVEVTAGFDTATAYKGWVLDRKEAEMITGGDDAPRQAVLETGLTAGGGQYTDLLGRITKTRTDSDAR